MTDNFTRFAHPKLDKELILNNFWLRDHCQCKLCYNYETHQRSVNILNINVDIKPAQTQINGDLFKVEWNDGHKSEYRVEFLKKSQLEEIAKQPDNQVLWGRNNIENLDVARVNFQDYLSNDKIAKKLVESLLRYGIAMVEKVPPTELMTEMVVKRLFPIQKTVFGEMWSVSTDVKEFDDFAFSNDHLGSHTDNTYFNDVAGLLILHCIQCAEKGGESFFVDGFNVVKNLKMNNPKTFERLTKVFVPGEFREEGKYYKHSAPLIELDNITKLPKQIRYNMNDRAVFNTIPQSEMPTFYKDLRVLINEVESEKNIWKFKLTPGTVIFFDNWRILHGRDSFIGKRCLSGCYVSREEFMSKALFPIQKTLFGEMWSVSADFKEHDDTAYSCMHLGSHTDNTYFNDAAGLQIFHCFQCAEKGGDSFFVDGFNVVNNLKKNNPQTYERLTKVFVPGEYKEEDKYYKYSAPIIELDNITKRPKQIRYNLYDRAVFNTIPQSEMPTFYKDLRVLNNEVESEKNIWKLKLTPGTVIFFDNWRILHGRDSFIGKRYLSGCYVSRAEFMSKARVLNLI